MRQQLVGLVEAIGFLCFTNKGAHNAHANNLLAQHSSNTVDAFLHEAILRNDADDDRADGNQQHWNRRDEDE